MKTSLICEAFHILDNFPLTFQFGLVIRKSRWSMYFFSSSQVNSALSISCFFCYWVLWFINQYDCILLRFSRWNAFTKKALRVKLIENCKSWIHFQLKSLKINNYISTRILELFYHKFIKRSKQLSIYHQEASNYKNSLIFLFCTKWFGGKRALLGKGRGGKEIC